MSFWKTGFIPGVNEKAILGSIIGGIPGLIGGAGEVKKTAQKVIGSTDVIPGFDPFTDRSKKTSGGNGTGDKGSTGHTGDPNTGQNYDNYATGGTVMGGGSGSWGAPQTGNPEEVAYWNDQLGYLDRLLGSVDTQKNQGLSRIQSSYNDAVNSTNRAQEKTLRNYGIQRNDTNSAKVGALNKVDESARTGFNSLQRLLGLSGAGNSAVAKELVPHVVAQEATGDRGEVVDTFGTNLRNLSLAEDDAKEQYKTVLSDLNKQQRTTQEDFLRGIETQRQELIQQKLDAANKKAMAGGASYTQAAATRQPFEQQRNQIQSTIDGLFNKYSNISPTAKPVNAQRVDLQDYTFDPAAIGGQAQGYAGNVASYLPWLQNRDDDDNRQRAF